MGIPINYNHKFTKVEREYLESRGMQYKVVENDRIFNAESKPEVDEKNGMVKGTPVEPAQPDGPVGLPINPQGPLNEDGDDSIDEDIIEYVESLKVAELKEELDDRKVDYPSDAKKDDLAELLVNAMQDERDGV